jgi:hypothetical protein
MPLPMFPAPTTPIGRSLLTVTFPSRETLGGISRRRRDGAVRAASLVTAAGGDKCAAAARRLDRRTGEDCNTASIPQRERAPRPSDRPRGSDLLHLSPAARLTLGLWRSPPSSPCRHKAGKLLPGRRSAPRRAGRSVRTFARRRRTCTTSARCSSTSRTSFAGFAARFARAVLGCAVGTVAAEQRRRLPLRAGLWGAPSGDDQPHVTGIVQTSRAHPVRIPPRVSELDRI